ncbi:Qb-SNARE [Thecamonas trahens ATCC 50062]|uniref:Qb-SNARE n=1 Tax=Thecamonas trahens ATCC 50062 TaxID=461836 RepID=A0A0L0D2N5_THETB|nr:Qb-SNARE [Thecamonas trahens ATCC 50062]KNC46450.1 Qb-SNARE [Thecamonas trahens ATCC 50062]|eukprot:XP_013760741.1 Qb-SNARE [Thecamonas trahens ATCC 50062]
MSALFENYESEYMAQSKTISNLLSEVRSQSGEQRKATMAGVERAFSAANNILRQMELEIRSLPPASKNKLTPRLRKYQADLTVLKRDMRRIGSQTSAQASRDELMAGAAPGAGAASLGTGGGAIMSTREIAQRQRILDGKRRLEETSNRLSNAQRLALESEEIGANTLSELHQQREIIERADRNLYIADDNVSRGHKLVRTMNRRLVTTKIITGVIVLLILGTIFTIIYFKWIKKK